MLVFSCWRNLCRFSLQNRKPWPVSIRMRCGPRPSRYVFVPCSVNLLGLPPVSLWIRGVSRESGGRGGSGDVIFGRRCDLEKVGVYDGCLKVMLCQSLITVRWIYY